MRVFKLMAIVAALALALAGCELDEEGADGGGTGGGDTAGGADTGGGTGASCEGIGSEITAAEWQAASDDNCGTTSFWDPDCVGHDPSEFSYTCGKSQCDFNDGVCEAMIPCGTVRCLIVGDIAFAAARPCPYDADCVGTADEPATACESDGHCDTWCPLLGGNSIDTDCGAGEGGDYCPGGPDADQCN